MKIKVKIQQNRQAGLSLIELMVTSILIIILSAIAYPNYEHILLKSRREQIKLKMRELQAGLVQAEIFDLPQPKIGKFTTKFYKISLQKRGGDTEITAVPVGRQSKDKCGRLVVWVDGSEGSLPGWCWG